MADIDDSVVPESAKDADLACVDAAIDDLLRRFETVQIFCTRESPVDDERGTVFVVKGRGNYYTRYGQVRVWMLEEDREHIGGLRC